MKALTKERRILMKGAMVQAVLDGVKTQTRRVMKGQADKCPYGKIGDFLWVRESFNLLTSIANTCGAVQCKRGPIFKDSHYGESQYMAWYDGTADPRTGWTFREKRVRSIFMPRWASRILLQITDIRLQRVQDISEEDATEEGACPCRTGNIMLPNPNTFHFWQLWDSINEKRGYGWNVNPWVWAITFKPVNIFRKLV